MRMTTVCMLAAACTTTARPAPDLASGERALRERLGIPLDAERVIVFGQNAHLDIDWQHTFDDYYALFVDDLLTQARQLVDAQPRAFYSVAEMAYVQRHLAAHPEEAAALRAASERGQLRVVGGGMTSPDTLLPEFELLARDFLFGIQFSEETLDAHPRAAWLPDSFGHGAAAPDILTAAGYTSVAFSRIDGAPTLTDEILGRRTMPLPDSAAAQLAALGTADFLWQGSGGATILAHFMAGSGLYCEGDNLDYSELLEPAGGHIGAFKGHDHAFTDASIDRYIGELGPYAQTPYMFVPIGCDFAAPKQELLTYLDGYNARHYGESGVYAIAAPFDSYSDLVTFHAANLPTISAELSPYFMGFLGSRADLKRGVRDAARPFFVAETFATLLGADGAAIMAAAAPALSKLTLADHHDFVTGTSADPVVAGEQLPMLAAARTVGTSVQAEVAAALASKIPASSGAISRAIALNASSVAQSTAVELEVPTIGGGLPTVRVLASGRELPVEKIGSPSATTARFRTVVTVAPFGWQAIDVVSGVARPPSPVVQLALLDDAGEPAVGAAVTRVVLTNERVHAEWHVVAGEFVLTSLVIDGAEAIAAPSLVVADYRDDGGLWRLGHEMPGCAFTPIARSTAAQSVRIVERGALRVRVAFIGPDATREVTLAAGDVGLDLALITGAAEGTSRTATIAFAVDGGSKLTTSVPGGAVTREVAHVYTPTYWAAVGWAQVGAWAVLLRQSTGVRMDTPGALELMAARDARQEACDQEGGTGSDPGVHRIEWRIVPARDAAAAELASTAFDRPIAVVPATGSGTGLPPDGSLLSIDGGGVISAVKPSTRGSGVIIRVLLLGGAATVHLSSWLSHTSISVVDLAERDLAPAIPADDVTFDPAYGSIRTVRAQ